MLNMILSIAESVGTILAGVEQARGNPAAATLITTTETAAGQIVTAVKAHVAANADLGLTEADVDAKIDAAKATALAAGDEAAARLAARGGDRQPA